MKKVVSGIIVLLLLLISMLMWTYNIKQVKAEWTGTVYIRADGSIDPPDAPITTNDNMTYTLIGSITSSGNGIIVERNNIILDCGGNIIQGVGFEWGGIAIQLIEMSNVTIKNANIKDIFEGIDLYKSSNNSLIGNNITDAGEGIFLHGTYEKLSKYNTIFGNNIARSHAEGIRFEYSSDNTIYHNNFVDNHLNVYCFASTNIWDDGYPSGGNHWSNYTGVDANYDGIGDTPYIIDESNQDSYPLVAPISVFNLGVWNGAQCKIDVISNSIISDVQASTLQKIISFNVSGIEGTSGFCRVAISNNIVQNLWQGNYMVLLNGKPWPFNNWTDTKNTYIYINYTHSEHKIVIIPEFPSTMILPPFMLTTLITTVLLMKKRKIERKLP
jgi:parallel beta-helix repeat protein